MNSARKKGRRPIAAAFLICVGFSILHATAEVRADDGKPISLGLFTPVQIVPEEQAISGFRFSLIYGSNSAVTGLDIGLVSRTATGPFKGVQISIVGLVEAEFTGVQYGFANVTKGYVEGLQWGAVNVAGSGTGAQLSTVSYSEGDFKGFQGGIFNYAKFMNGLQLGLINYAGSMKGLQIGLINIISQGGFLPVFPIVNWSF